MTQSCKGQALDRVTKQKHRPNMRKLSRKCPKIVLSAPPDKFRTFYGICRTFCRHSLSNDLPVTNTENDDIRGRFFVYIFVSTLVFILMRTFMGVLMGQKFACACSMLLSHEHPKKVDAFSPVQDGLGHDPPRVCS